MIKVLTNDGLENASIEALNGLGVEVVNEHFNQDILGAKLKEFDAVVIRSATKLTADVFEAEAGGNLKLAIRAGVGIDNIDIPAAQGKGVTVRNTPSASSDSVAELAIGHMFALARFIAISNYTMRNGEWNKKKYEGTEIAGKTLGIVGMGRIGQSLAKKATALGMKVVYYTIEGKHDDLDYDFVSLEEVLKVSDFISLHVPYDKAAGSLIGKKELELMKNTAYLINCARGKVVDEAALIEALNKGEIAGAGIDVFEEEPTKNEELINHPKVSATPHIGAATKEAQTRIGEEVVSVIKEFFNL
ncbi:MULTISPECIES: D-2-hydroxyacid dehydrogenase [Clostridium]|jgi:Phosphoglycerate dehydrogenase and related dehydrogenases|uniref:3-phosphoglycerate dehydrogenase n=3 Tax=Clostridium TaxID=1485 RepID=A0AAE2RRN5_CLOBE|nr:MULTISPECIES: D-2-hydroxyacid dehydrogenase [Clostridium]ABR37033.1 D-isomer specific 2-hydroxyacid dehydrogenase, NAD-binding [Clostridium beijerinckii NCIMB 8052]AIU02146.1 D-isomer specific 2-hydroxyacid dehydrogenase, NAD-binding protein [Clostridium beijerinckii ATCC 35702]ALB43942.1 3-phosphoglycerate dehydrogenase [Clostridium beijerinckii NRRL B-598]AVK48845.1 3-phosphoglycerate dehydrogenase [Clostridium sp. MF28]MBC2458218.1 3-phosphoglycerate dehydrogenase [Clostridium beijerinck